MYLSAASVSDRCMIGHVLPPGIAVDTIRIKPQATVTLQPFKIQTRGDYKFHRSNFFVDKACDLTRKHDIL